MGAFKIKYQTAFNERAKEVRRIFRDGSDLTPYIYAVKVLGAVRVLRIRDLEKNGQELDVKRIAEAVGDIEPAPVVMPTPEAAPEADVVPDPAPPAPKPKPKKKAARKKSPKKKKKK